MARITHWTIKIKWDDGIEEFIEHIPSNIARPVDEMLDMLEQVKSNKNKYEEHRGTN